MKIARCKLKSVAPYSQSRKYELEVPKEEKEAHDAYEKRTWRHKCHTTADGRVFIPPMCFKQAIDKAASMLRQKIPGKGNSEYGKHFRAGVMCFEPLVLPLKAGETVEEWIYANADGLRGGSKRVMRCFPKIESWAGVVEFVILDDTVTKEVFEHHLREAGKFVGIGRFRAERGGFYGRFSVESVEWEAR